jgi:hypothetical protein
MFFVEAVTTTTNNSVYEIHQNTGIGLDGTITILCPAIMFVETEAAALLNVADWIWEGYDWEYGMNINSWFNQGSANDNGDAELSIQFIRRTIKFSVTSYLKKGPFGLTLWSYNGLKLFISRNSDDSDYIPLPNETWVAALYSAIYWYFVTQLDVGNWRHFREVGNTFINGFDVTSGKKVEDINGALLLGQFFVSVGAKTSSFTRVGNLDIWHYVAENVTNHQYTQYKMDCVTLGIPAMEGMKPVFMKAFIEALGDYRIRLLLGNDHLTYSDSVWSDDFWAGFGHEFDVLSLTLHIGQLLFYIPPATAATDLLHMKNLVKIANPHIVVGCEDKDSPVKGLFVRNGKNSKMSNPLTVWTSPPFSTQTRDTWTNCVLACIHKHCGAIVNNHKLRKELLHINQLDTVLKEYNIRAFVVFAKYSTDVHISMSTDSGTYYGLPQTGVIPDMSLLVYEHKTFNNNKCHAIIVNRPELVSNKSKCRHCFHWFLSSNIRHFNSCTRCPDCHQIMTKNHYQNCKAKTRLEVQRDGEHVTVMTTPKRLEKEEDLRRNVWFADLESFTNARGVHVPYCACIAAVEDDGIDKVKCFYGEDCMEEFVDYLLDFKESGYLYFHNGAGFDNHFLVYALMTSANIFGEGMQLVYRGSKIIGMDIKLRNGKLLKVRDFYLVINQSLAKMCKDFKIDQSQAKLSFDHTKISSWAKVHEHKKEVKLYCKHDCLALRIIYLAFSLALWKIAPCLLPVSMSLAQHALSMWKNIESSSAINTVVLPKDMKDYEIFRSTYYGGRVLATVPCYDSNIWKVMNSGPEGFISSMNMDYTIIQEVISDNIGNELKKLDVNSLYPFCMWNYEYPLGNYKKSVIKDPVLASVWYSMQHETILEEMDKAFYLVDIDANPKLLVAFLMRRNEQGESRQTLDPFRKHWITGPELREALLVGYKLLAVYEKIVFEKKEKIFTKYISLLHKIKQDNKHDKTSCMYMAAKLLMNALSGKFGQKVRGDVHIVLQDLPDDPEKLTEKLEKIYYEVIESIYPPELPVGFVLHAQKKEEDLEATLPTYLSAFILAYSRVWMSKILRCVNGYYDRNHTLLYTDTDSLLVRQDTFNILVKNKYIGDELGMLVDEFPNDLIIAGRFLAPKTYCLAIALWQNDIKNYMLGYQVRCKGIPHEGGIIKFKDYASPAAYKQTLEDYAKQLDNPVGNLKNRFYVMEPKLEPYVKYPIKYIDIDTCDALLRNTHYLECHYGSMLRNKAGRFSILTKWCHRKVSEINWWHSDKCTRKTDILDQHYGISECIGGPPEITTPLDILATVATTPALNWNQLAFLADPDPNCLDLILDDEPIWIPDENIIIPDSPPDGWDGDIDVEDITSLTRKRDD